MAREEQIFLGSSLATSREILLKKNVDLETEEGIQRMFSLAIKIYKQGIVSNFLDTAERGVSSMESKECPRCKKSIHISWKKHFECGWVE